MTLFAGGNPAGELTLAAHCGVCLTFLFRQESKQRTDLGEAMGAPPVADIAT